MGEPNNKIYKPHENIKPEINTKKEVGKMGTVSREVAFVNSFSNFYETFFSTTADLAELLADIQRDFPEDYHNVVSFGKDPDAINNLIEQLPDYKQATLLKILLRAGRFGKELVNLFEISEPQKRKLALEIRKFAEELKAEMKKKENDNQSGISSSITEKK